MTTLPPTNSTFPVRLCHLLFMPSGDASAEGGVARRMLVEQSPPPPLTYKSPADPSSPALPQHPRPHPSHSSLILSMALKVLAIGGSRNIGYYASLRLLGRGCSSAATCFAD